MSKEPTEAEKKKLVFLLESSILWLGAILNVFSTNFLKYISAGKRLLPLLLLIFVSYGYLAGSFEAHKGSLKVIALSGIMNPFDNSLVAIGNLKDSLSEEEEESALLAAVDDHEEKEPISTSKSIALTGFYGESKYPSHSMYKKWDTLTLYPYSESIREEDKEIKLVIQDKNNYCNYVPPFQGFITSSYGPRGGRNHYGIDIDLETNDPVLASFDGMVRISQNHPSYGNVVIIRHYNGLETVYAHLHQLKVEPGDIVNAGEVIGLGGNTGRSTGSHLHYEIRFKGMPLNPSNVISFKENCLLSDSIKVAKVESSYVAYPMGIPFHSVKKGEYLYLIAKKYGTTVSHLCEINGIPRNKPLQVGQKLRIG